MPVQQSDEAKDPRGNDDVGARVGRLSKHEGRVKTRSDDERTVEEGGARPQEIPVVSEEAVPRFQRSASGDEDKKRETKGFDNQRRDCS